MKVAILTPTLFEYSGIDRVAKKQSEDLIHKGCKVTVFALQSEIKLDNAINMEIIGMSRNTFFQRIYRLLFPLDFIKSIKYIKKLKNYDVIISHHYPMNWLAYMTKKLYGVRYIYHHHPLMPTFSLGYIQRIYLNIFYFMNKVTVKNADLVLSISNFAREEFKKCTGMDSIVVYNKIDMTRFNNSINRQEIRMKYSLENSPIILFIGQIHPHKGLHLLIEAFNIVKETIPDAKLLIVGKPPLKGYFRNLKKKSNSSIIFTGFITDEELPSYYAASDVYASASLWEGFNLPMVEAMAHSKPVVAFNIGPHEEIINLDTGFLVDKSDCEAFAQALIKIINEPDLAARMGHAGYKRVKEYFTSSTENIIQILENGVN
ncbi:Trehalose synthase [uncultured archaeon]|nr:Trehalose synthase [uncultured archaeon]